MRCPACGTENPDGARHCASCGISLESQSEEAQSIIYCTSCGSENPADARFCIRCGTGLRAAPERGTPSGIGPPNWEPGLAVGNLVPRDLSGLLSEAFRVYRRRFWVFFFIVFLAQIPSLIAELTPIPVLSVLFSLAGLPLLFLAQGAIIFAVLRQYLGRDISVGDSYRMAQGKFWNLLAGGIGFVGILLGCAILILIIVGIPLVFYVSVSLIFYPQAILVEGKAPLDALGRSRRLVRGSWWRVFGILIVFWIIILSISIPAIIAWIFSPTAGVIVGFITGSVTTPIALIGDTLIYFDLRIRKEGYTLETMASEVAI